jgi:hypothetical protein
VEGGNATRIGRFANYLRNLLPSNDPVVMEMASKAIGRLAMAGDTFTAEYVEFEVKRALEWLGADRNEGRRHAAVSACREKHSQVWGVVVHDGSPFASIRDYPRKSWVLLGQGSRL